VLKLEDKDVYQVMTPRSEVFVLEMHKRVKDNMRRIIEKGYSKEYIKKKLEESGWTEETIKQFI